MGFSRQEYWSGLSFLSLGDLPNPEIEPTSPVSPSLSGSFFTTESPGKRGRGWQKQHMNPGRSSSYLQHSSSYHNQWFCPSAEPSWGCTLMRELGQEQFCLIQIPRQGVLLAPELSLSIHRQGGESQLHSLRRVSSGPICPEGLMATPGTCAAQLEPREGQAEPRVCKEIVVTLFTQETWGCGLV